MWEKRYKAVKPERTATNIRFYKDCDLVKLLNISTLNRHGIKISNILKMPPEAINEKILEISNISHDNDNYINNLVVAMIDMNEDGFERILSNTLLKIGFEKTVTNVLYPFLEKIGILWLIGTINPAQEHFIVNLIRQKLIVAIDGLEKIQIEKAKTFLLFLPENEFHELGLLFYTYIIKKSGHQVVYLGQSVPINDVIEVNNIRKTDYLLTYFVSALAPEDIPPYLAKVSNALPDKTMFITGYQVTQHKWDLPKNVVAISNIDDFRGKMKDL